MYAGECWHKDKSEAPVTRISVKALKDVAQLNERLAEKDSESEASDAQNKFDDEYPIVSIVSTDQLPSTCKIMRAQLQVCEPAHPDT